MVWGWPTMPKRGAAEIAMRRSRSSLRPVTSACTGAWKPSAGGVGGNVMHPAIGDQERAGDAIDRNVRQRRGQRAEQFGAVGFAVGLSGLDDAHFQPLDLLQRVDQRLLRLGRLLVAGAEILARALVDHDRRDRGQRLAVLAGEGRVGERQQDQRQRGDAHGGATRRARAAAAPRSRRSRPARSTARSSERGG